MIFIILLQSLNASRIKTNELNKSKVHRFLIVKMHTKECATGI